jgi:hypothetical protein
LNLLGVTVEKNRRRKHMRRKKRDRKKVPDITFYKPLLFYLWKDPAFSFKEETKKFESFHLFSYFGQLGGPLPQNSWIL